MVSPMSVLPPLPPLQDKPGLLLLQDVVHHIITRHVLPGCPGNGRLFTSRS